VDRVAAEFAGERAGTAPLTWGQRGMWEATQRNPPGHFNIPVSLPVPRRPATSVAVAAAAIGGLVSRHESLRTRIVTGDPEPLQVVARRGRLPVDVVEAGGDPMGGGPVVTDDIDAVAAALRTRLAAPAFDHARDWPLRVGLVTVDGQVRRIALVFCHLAADWHGITVALRDLRLLLRGSAPPAATTHPLDLARWQRTAGQAHSRRAVAYWTAASRTIPPTMFAVDGDPPDRPHERAVLTSRALDLAARVIAARQRVSTSTVLLAATAALVGAATGHERCALNTLVHNRFQADHAGVVGMLAQLGLVVVDVGGAPPFADLVTRTWQAAMLAYRNAYYDQVAVDGALARVGRERGAPVNPYCCFNDQRATVDTEPDGGAAGALPGAAEVRAALAGTTVGVSPHARLNCRFCLRLEPASGTLRVLLLADPRCFPGSHSGQFLRDLERLVVDAAFPPA
jgi:hypothetical protein